MISISQSDYIDFVHRSGLSKMSKVRSIYTRPEYHPSLDFYKALREELSDFLKTKKSRRELLDFVATQREKKRPRFAELVDGYLRYLGRKKAIWFEPPTALWKHKDLSVKINPEVGLEINGEKFIVKLYLKQDKLMPSAVKIMLWMMESELSSGMFSGYRCAVLDVGRSKLHYFRTPEPPITELIIGEAELFISLWNSLERKSA